MWNLNFFYYSVWENKKYMIFLHFKKNIIRKYLIPDSNYMKIDPDEGKVLIISN